MLWADPRPMLPMWGLQVRPQNGQGFPERAKSSEKRRTKKEARKPSSAAGACGSRRCRSTEAEVQAHTDEPSGIRIRPKKLQELIPGKHTLPFLHLKGHRSRYQGVYQCAAFSSEAIALQIVLEHIFHFHQEAHPYQPDQTRTNCGVIAGKPGYFGTSASHQKLVPSCV